MNPFKISECSVGTADACGSVYLNFAFEQAIRTRLGRYAEQVLKPRCLADIIRNFDLFIKVRFQNNESETDLVIPVPGAPNVPELGIADGYMTFPRYIVLGFI